MNEIKESRLEGQIKSGSRWGDYEKVKKIANLLLSWENPVNRFRPSDLNEYKVDGGRQKENIIDRYYTDHGSDHSRRIIEHLNRLTEGIELRDEEVFLLLCGAWLHDIGMFVGIKEGESYDETRKRHHIRSAEWVKKLTKPEEFQRIKGWERLIEEQLTFSFFNVDDELVHIEDLCKGHRGRKHFESLQKEKIMTGGVKIRIRLLVAFLRIADECDIDKRRSPLLIYTLYKGRIPFTEYSFWEKNLCVESIVPNPEIGVASIIINLHFWEDRPNFQLTPMEKNKASIVREIENKLKEELSIVASDFIEHKINIACVHFKDYNFPDKDLVEELKVEKEKDIFQLSKNLYRNKDLVEELKVEKEVFDGLSNFEEIEKQIEADKSRKEMIVADENRRIACAQMFYDGNMPRWLEIMLGLDGKRLQLQETLSLAERFGKEAKESFKSSFIIITGEAGTGKTTSLFRCGYELYNKYKGEFEFLRLISGCSFEKEEITKYYNQKLKPVYILVDIYDPKGIKEDLINASKEFQTNNIPAIIIAVARKNEWDNADVRSGLAFNQYKEIELDSLEEEEIDDIINLLEKNKQLGRLANLTHRRRVEEFKEKAKGQLLVAMRMAREEEEGKPFEERIVDEYRNLRKDSEAAGEAYLYTCLLFAYGIFTPRNLLKNVVGSPSLDDFKKRVLKPACKVIVPHDKGWIDYLCPRHSLIAEIIVQSELTDLETRKEKIKKLIEAIDTTNRGERYIAMELLKRMLEQGKRLMVESEKELVKRILEECCYLEECYWKIREIKRQALIEGIDVELLRWSFIHHELDDYEGSKECLDGVLRIDSENPSNNYYYALVLTKLHPSPTQEMTETIVTHFEKAYKGGFRIPQVFFVYGNFLRLRGQFERAIEILEEGKKLYPDNEKIREEYKLTQELLYDDSCKKLLFENQKKLKINPRDTKTMWYLALSFEHTGDIQKALEYYKMIILVESWHGAALQKCADILQSQGKDEEAVKYLRGYIKVHKKKDNCAAKARNDLARIIVKTGIGDYEKAEGLWKEAIDIYPQFVWSYIELGNFYFDRRNDFKRAISYLQKGKMLAEQKSLESAIEKVELILNKLKQEIGQEKFENLLIELIRRDEGF